MKKSLICQYDELDTSSFKIFQIGKVSLGIILYEGNVKCYLNICPHAGAPVCIGKVSYLKSAAVPFLTDFDRDRKVVSCPWHGYEFNIADGKSVVEGCGKLIPVKTEVIGKSIFVLL